MMILLVQIFLLLLAAFLAGAATACLFRRMFFGRGFDGGAGPRPPNDFQPPPLKPGNPDQRFERALTGGAVSTVPPQFQRSDAPMIEVQPIARPASPRLQPVIAQAPPQPAELPTPSSRQAVPGGAPPVGPASSATPAPPTAENVAPRPAAATPPDTYFSVTVAAAAAAAAAKAGVTGPAGEDLTRIRGLDATAQERLRQNGVLRIADIAGWKAPDIARFSQTLGFAGRIERENWVEQARFLIREGGAAAPAAANDDDVSVPPSVPATSSFGTPFGSDRLQEIRGIDPTTERFLNANGITRFSQIASWTGTDIDEIEKRLEAPGRVGLEKWVEQAKVLSPKVAELAPVRTRADDTAPAVPDMPDTPSAPAAAPTPRQGSRRDVSQLRSVRSEALTGEIFAPIPPLSAAALDDLKRIRGVGLLIEKKLISLGVTKYEQIANWSGADVDRISQMLDFKGRIERENWIEQARILASGGATDFSRRADRGEVETSRNQRG
jgi:predicted flap endonuclease-1-like 5' DNA nuclease